MCIRIRPIEDKWTLVYDKKIREQNTASLEQFTVIQIDVPVVHDTIAYLKTGWIMRKENYAAKVVCIPAFPDPRPISLKDAKALLDLLEKENEVPNRYFFIVTWLHFRKRFPN